MVEAAQRGVLDGIAIGTERIELHHPAEGIEAVAVVVGGAGAADLAVPALVLLARGRIPPIGIGAPLGQAVALEGDDLCRAAPPWRRRCRP